jgi:microcin C transport system permease protein
MGFGCRLRPSGELAAKPKQNLPGVAGFHRIFTFAISTLAFIFEGVRDAFDPEKTFS